MNIATFDTLKITEKLEASGFSHEQARGVVDVLRDERVQLEYSAVTKEHLDLRLKELELRMTVRLGTMMVIAIGVVATLVKLL